ncbi:MAG: hypothetical protein CFH07_01817, partial [Alphaproteobacteria bacterium MarineAlpha3_Bin6]
LEAYTGSGETTKSEMVKKDPVRPYQILTVALSWPDPTLRNKLRHRWLK